MPRYHYQAINDAGKLLRGTVFAFQVDEFLGIQEVVIKTMGRQLNRGPSDELLRFEIS